MYVCMYVVIYASKVAAKEKLEKLKSDLNRTRTHTLQYQ